MENKFVLLEGQGSMFNESNCQVIQSGKMLINGKERYAKIIKFTNPTGEEKFELVFSAGLLKNVEFEKSKDGFPDLKGLVNINFENLKTYEFAAWHKRSASGTTWTSTKLREHKFKDKVDQNTKGEDLSFEEKFKPPF
jgi:hypothetical protein